MRDNKPMTDTRRLVYSGVSIALVFLATMFTRIPGPVPPGYINLGDSMIMLTAVFLGKGTGFVAGAFGSALADIVAPGGLIFAPITFVVKGIEGYVVAAMTRGKGRSGKGLVFPLIVGGTIMAVGYFIAEMTVLKAFDPVFGLSAALAELPFNAIQGGVSVVVVLLLSKLLEKAGINKYL